MQWRFNGTNTLHEYSLFSHRLYDIHSRILFQSSILPKCFSHYWHIIEFCHGIVTGRVSPYRPGLLPGTLIHLQMSITWWNVQGSFRDQPERTSIAILTHYHHHITIVVVVAPLSSAGLVQFLWIVTGTDGHNLGTSLVETMAKRLQAAPHYLGYFFTPIFCFISLYGVMRMWRL